MCFWRDDRTEEEFGPGIMTEQEGVFAEVPSEEQTSVWEGLRELQKMVTQKTGLSTGKGFFDHLRG